MCQCAWVCRTSMCIGLISHSFSVCNMCCLWQIHCTKCSWVRTVCAGSGQSIVWLTEKRSRPLTRRQKIFVSKVSIWVWTGAKIHQPVKFCWPLRETETESPPQCSGGSQCIFLSSLFDNHFHRDNSSGANIAQQEMDSAFCSTLSGDDLICHGMQTFSKPSPFAFLSYGLIYSLYIEQLCVCPSPSTHTH